MRNNTLNIKILETALKNTFPHPSLLFMAQLDSQFLCLLPSSGTGDWEMKNEGSGQFIIHV